MTADNRTNEPTPEQVEAGLNRVDWDAIRAGEADPREAAAHAIWHALQAAAQGAAPQAKGEPPCSIRQEIPWPPHASATFMYSRYLCECGWAGNTFRDTKDGDGKKLALEIAKRHFEESLAPPVLPSSGVDEDAAIQLVQNLAREAYEAYEDSSDDAYGAWSWLTERHEQMRAGRVLAGKEKNE